MSQELPEDDPLLGVKDLKQFEINKEGKTRRILFIGITCGLSGIFLQLFISKE
jgi:hypothetical protein